MTSSFQYFNALSASQVRALDKHTINKYGIPSIVLMERAGRAVAQEVLLFVKRLRADIANPKVAVFCGKGNNGGDGMVCARYLSSAGLSVQVYLLCAKSKLKGDAYYNMLTIKKFNRLKKTFKSDIIIDAIFGTGFHGRPDSDYESVIKAINRNPAYKIAVDVPSGLDATTGKVEGSAVAVDKTVTMGFPKTGFYKNDGPLYCGKIKVVDIGLRSN
jgi:ADP-dependent NAD(P)H-hydrate dehydratase / NAD(P)H-hydrate epimerase